MEGVKRIYFETSSVNYLSDLIFRNPNFGSLATKKLQIEKGRKWQISNVTLWEIFLTKDENRRYDLFDLSRCLFYDTLICSPEEIIINYIKAGCPVIENQYELDSKALFSNEWSLACKNLDYAFQPDRGQLEDFTKHLRFLGEYFVKTNKGFSLKRFNDFDSVSDKINGAFLKSIFDKLAKEYDRPLDDEDKNYIGYSLQMVMIILCFGIGFDQPTIENFWNKNKKTEPLERLEIAANNFPSIFFRGPLANITKMIILQSKNKTGRGMYFDSLQAIYTTYSDLFVTNDEHFLKFKNENANDPNMFKIISIKDINFFNV
ncbi:MAG: hypothetical protein ACOX32_05160 [Bacteroidaceae bacterium]|jgi:hypothetical protein